MKVCSRKDCTSATAAKWKPVLNAYAKGYPQTAGNRAEFDFKNITLCDHCKETAKAKDFVTDAGWKQIVTVFQVQGRAQPDRASIFLTFEEAPSGEGT